MKKYGCAFCEDDPCTCPVEFFDYPAETNSTVDDRERRQDLGCSFCRPNRGENAKRRPRHGKTKPRAKEKRR
jgi:hypothetical protein